MMNQPRRDKPVDGTRWATAWLLTVLVVLLLAAKPAAAESNTVRSWGFNFEGQLGNGASGINADVNVPGGVGGGLGGLADVKAVEGGCVHTLALKKDGTVWAWGSNSSGQLGGGNSGGLSTTPVQVGNLSNVKAVAAGCAHNMALKDNGTVWTWGYNEHGELGNGTSGPNADGLVPEQVDNLNGVTAIAAGGHHSLALKSNGTVRAWGYNMTGQLGTGYMGFNTDSTVPVSVKYLSGVRTIAAGGMHSLALKSDGTVWGWGSNWKGQLGDGTNTHRKVPVKANNLSRVTAIAAGGSHSLAIKQPLFGANRVVAWGANADGQLGNETNVDANTPVQVSGLSGVAAIASGARHSLALESDGTVRSWGLNDYGQLGDGTNTAADAPVEVDGLGAVRFVAAGSHHTLVVQQ